MNSCNGAIAEHNVPKIAYMPLEVITLQGTDHIITVPNTVDFDIIMLLIQERCEDTRKKNTMNLLFFFSVSSQLGTGVSSFNQPWRLKNRNVFSLRLFEVEVKVVRFTQCSLCGVFSVVLTVLPY